MHGKFYRDRPRGTPPLGELNTTGVAKYSDFGPIQGDRHVAQSFQFLAIYQLRWYTMYITLHRAGGLNARRVAKYSDFGPIEGYISETAQDRSQVSMNH